MSRRNPEGRMRLVEHFTEFRNRILLISGGLVVGMIVGWFLFDPVFEALQAPVIAIQKEGRAASLNFGAVTSAFDMRIRVSLFLGAIVSAPWWLYQLWAFVAPGLRRTEKRYVLLFLGGGIPLFAAGAASGWMILPHAVSVLTAMTPDDGSNLMDARTYLTFAMRLIFAFAIAYLFPIVMITLNLMGIVTAKGLLKGWRWAVVLIFTFAAIANPLPDPWSMIVLGVMMTGLYFAAIGIAALVDRHRAKKKKKALAG